MNNIEFAKYCHSKVGCYYWFGTFGQMASLSLYNDRKKAYPKYYTATDFKKQIANPKQVFDCAGLPKSIILLKKYIPSDDLGATGIYGKCKKKGSIKDIKSLKIGTLLFKGNDKTKTHVGVYQGNGIITEAKGHAYGVIESKYNSTWKYWAEYYAVDYIEAAPVPDPVPEKPSNEYKVNTKSDPLMLRTGPGLQFSIMAKMKKGSIVKFISSSGSWYKVQYKTMIGYAYASYLEKV